MNKDLRHPTDRTGLNLCKSVKSVGHKKDYQKRICVICEICVTLIICGLNRLDRIGRFPSKFRA